MDPERIELPNSLLAKAFSHYSIFSKNAFVQCKQINQKGNLYERATHLHEFLDIFNMIINFF